MISRVKGNLTAVDDESAFVETGGLVYEVLVPANLVATLSKMLNGGNSRPEVDFHTVHYIEGGFNTGHMVPRLVGFLNAEDREFFRIFTRVKGIGVRKALRAFCIPTAQMVRAIQTANRAVLMQLPEIGARTADRVIAELKGKLDGFALEHPAAPELKPEPEYEELVEQARQILMLQLRYTQAEADAMISKVMAANRNIRTMQQLLGEVFSRHQQGRA